MRIWHGGKAQDLSEILAACLEEIDSPAQIADCLERHPDHAAELAPLLRSALSFRQVMAAPIREDRRLEARRRFLQAAASHSWEASQYATGRLPGPRQTPNVLLRPLWSTFAPAVVAAALFVVALVPIMSLTSVSALPGDWNYGFKRSSERVRLALTLDPGARLNLELAFHTRRLGEIERLAADGRLNDPMLVQQFADESSALVQAVSVNPQLGPSEALKVAEQTQNQVQVLSDKVAPLASASVKPAVDDAVQQSHQVQLKATEVVQAKAESAATHSQPSGPKQNGRTKSTLTPPTSSDSSSALASATPTATATAAADSATATATATLPAATPTATPAPSSTAVTLVPPALAPPTTLRTPTPPVLRPPASQPSVSQPVVTQPTVAAPLIPPSQPPAASQQIVAKQLPPGQTTAFTYTGAEMPITQALSSIAGSYDAVFYTQPREHGGTVFEWYPGQSDPSIILEPGSQVAVHVKPGAPATLSFATAPEILPH
jgi:hypothetical protein